MRDRIAIIDINTKKFKAISYKQYDENNILQIVVLENGIIKGLSNYITTVRFQLPSGKIYKINGIIENNTIKVVLTSAILNEYGKVIVELELASDTQIITTFSMYLNIEKSINKELSHDPDSIPDINDKLHTHENKEILDKITQEMINSILEFEELLELDVYATKDYVQSEIEKIDINTDDIDLSNYYTKEEVDEKFENIDVNIDNIDLSNYAKKEDLDAKADNLFQTSILTQSTLGGISAGTDLNNMSLQDVLTKLLYPYIAPTISSSITYSPTGNIYEYGQVVTVTNIKATVTKKSEDITSIRFYQNNSLCNELTETVSLGGSFTYTFPSPISITSSIANSYFQAKATDKSGKIVTANTVALSFYYPYYYGVIDADIEITEELIKGLTKQVVAKGNKSYTYNPNYQRMVIAYPKSYGVLKSILDPNGFEQINSFSCTELSIVGLDKTSQLYYVYSNDASTNSNFTMKFNY